MATEVAVDAYGLFDGPSYTEAHFSALTALVRGSGVCRGEDNDCAPSVSSSNVRIATGKVFVKGFYGTITSNKDVAPTAPHASLNRIDRVVLRLDRSDNEITVGVVTGTAASTPSAPALTNNATIWETRLAQVLVAGGSGTLTVTDEREYARGIGEVSPGTVKIWAGTTEETSGGWLGCYGQAVSRITYWELFAATGTAYGTGNGSTTFNVPDLRDRVPVGADNMFGTAGAAARIGEPNDLGEVGGTADVPLTLTPTTGESANHTHGGVTTGAGFSAGVDADHSHNYSAAVTANGNIPPYQIVNYEIKV